MVSIWKEDTKHKFHGDKDEDKNTKVRYNRTVEMKKTCNKQWKIKGNKVTLQNMS